ncbi:MAG TPA: GspH/FimT family pseudopilin [Methylomirabilota bacterium]|jgi:Tfp pilus assembly protein FimT
MPQSPTRPRHSYLSGGFTLVEVTVILGIAAVLAAISAPTLLSYWDSAALHAAARELASTINLGRQLAISTKTPVCVEVSATAARLRVGGCAGTAWTGAVTDGSGAIHVSGAAILQVSSNSRVVFTALGAAIPAATYTLTHTRTKASRSVVVAASGRVSVE